MFKEQPWIHSSTVDGLFLLSPPFLAILLATFFVHFWGVDAEIGSGLWFLLIVCVDVAHVYATLYRTYFDSEERRSRAWLYCYLPLFAWALGVILYSFGELTFWRAFAYLAVFHFVRQQYGFFQIYSRHETRGNWERRLDKTAIYATTLYPLLYWHFHLPRNFAWFVEGDFFSHVLPPRLANFCSTSSLVIYSFVLTTYFMKEFLLSWKRKNINLPKNITLLGTALSWYFGIVYWNGDLTFTLINILAHGVPYFAFVWSYAEKKYRIEHFHQKTSRYFVCVFLIGLILLAFIEEGLWDALVSREHSIFFTSFSFLPHIQNASILNLIVPLLALPQLTHYLLDGFIWKRSSLSVNFLAGSESKNTIELQLSDTALNLAE